LIAASYLQELSIMSKTAAFLGLALVVAFPGVLSAQEPTQTEDIGSIQLLIDPSHATRTRIPLAVPDAMNLGDSDPYLTAATISLTLRRDLELAGYFSVLAPAAFFFDQHADGMTASTINFQNWFNVGAQGLVKTSFRVAGSQVRLDFRLFDVAAGSEIELAWEPATVGSSDVEGQVHEFANQVVEYYSGFRGPFGSVIAFAARGQDSSQEGPMVVAAMHRVTAPQPEFCPSSAVPGWFHHLHEQ
jgi:TolB protein